MSAVNSHTFESALDDLELRLGRLRTLYEQYVGGREDVDPLGLESDIARRLALLEREVAPRSGASSRLSVLRERHESFKRYGERLPRRMQNGRDGSDRPPSSAPVPRGVPPQDGSWSDTTPPLGTPALVTPWMDAGAPAGLSRQTRVLALAEYLPGAAAPPPSDAAVTVPSPHAVVQPSSSEAPPPLFYPEDTSKTVQDLRPAFEDDLETLPRYHVEKPSRPPAPKISAEQVREIYERLVAATPKHGRTVTLERLACMLEETELKLRERHGGERSISFEVVVKDGRPVIKPIVR